MGKVTLPETTIDDIALEVGAVLVRSDGSVFNKAARVVNRVKSQVDDVAPPPTGIDAATLQAIVEAVLSKLPPPTHVVDVKVPELAIPAAPPPTVVVQKPTHGWEFEFERNGDGSIKKIVARPVEQ